MSRFNILYVVVLLYTILALAFWGYSLYRQDKILLSKEREIEMHKYLNQEDYTENILRLEAKHKRKSIQYIGEGATFLFIILVGAFIVFRSFKKRLEFTQQQNNFMLSITHELKTPIAGIKLSLETMQKRKLTEQQSATMMFNAVNEADRLNELCNNILLSTQIDSKNIKRGTNWDKNNFQEIDLAVVLENTFQTFVKRYANINWKKKFELEEIKITGNEFLWQLAFNNLIENAVKYLDKGEEIVLSTKKESKNIVIKIADEGIGIPDEDKKKIFQKFYRVGNENVRNFKGTGLGLYIVKRVMDVHHCKIEMQNNVQAGTGNIAIISITQTS